MAVAIRGQEEEQVGIDLHMLGSRATKVAQCEINHYLDVVFEPQRFPAEGLNLHGWIPIVMSWNNTFHTNPRSFIKYESIFSSVGSTFRGLGTLYSLTGLNRSQECIHCEDAKARYLKPPFFALSGLLFLIGGFAGECYAWARLNKDFAMDMNVARDTVLFFFAAAIIGVGVWLTISGFAMF